MRTRNAFLALVITLALSACGASQAGEACPEPTKEQAQRAFDQMRLANPECVPGDGVFFPWRAIAAHGAQGPELGMTADAMAADALGVAVRDYRLMQPPKVLTVQGCGDGACFLWVCTNRKWLPKAFQTGTATVSPTVDYTGLEEAAKRQCRVDLARQLLPMSMVVESSTTDEGTLVQAIREVLKVTDMTIAIRYSPADWGGTNSVVRVGCWLDMRAL